MHRGGIDESIFDFEIPQDIVIDLDTHEKMCCEKYLDTAIDKYDVFKLLYCHIKGDLYKALDGKKMVMLSRRNKFRCLVSVMVAKQTDIWRGPNNVIEQFSMGFDITVKRIRAMLKQEDALYKRYKPTVIYYEDDFDKSYQTVCEEMGISVEEPIFKTSPTGVQAEDIISNYSELRELDKEFFISGKLL